ncbi:MAG: hypothetical protein EA397_20055 [Deltaproteobacteria bacterium]|nr:MAG: hypothetical protein EA397_20055 [Deltaproteobacteria bacterium]
MRFTLVLMLVAGPLVAACDNSCQKICTRMARHADRCGFDVDSEDIAECKELQAGSASREFRSSCREYNGRRAIEEEWSCEDIAVYWGIDPEAIR